MNMEEINRLHDEIDIKIQYIEDYQKLIDQIDSILTNPASNRKFMQIAEPARRIKNLIKTFKSAPLKRPRKKKTVSLFAAINLFTETNG